MQKNPDVIFYEDYAKEQKEIVLTDIQQKLIDAITPYNFEELIRYYFRKAKDFTEYEDRLIYPATEQSIEEMTLSIDNNFGFTKDPNYKVEDSLTYKLLSDPQFFEEFRANKEKLNESIPHRQIQIEDLKESKCEEVKLEDEVEK
jgi:hypothetical protein